MCKQNRVLQAYNQFVPTMFRIFIWNHSFVLHSYHLYFNTYSNWSRSTRILMSEIDFWAKTQQLDFLKKHLSQDWGTLEAPETSLLELLTRRIQLCIMKKFMAMFIFLGNFSSIFLRKPSKKKMWNFTTHHWMSPSESFSCVVLDLSQPSRCHGKLLFFASAHDAQSNCNICPPNNVLICMFSGTKGTNAQNHKKIICTHVFVFLFVFFSCKCRDKWEKSWS